MSIVTLFKKAYIKLKSAVAEPKPVRERFGSNLVMDETSILQEGSGFYFNPKYSRENRPCIIIGKKCLIRATFIFEHELGKVTIGDNVYIGGATLISKTEIAIGNNVTMAYGITVYDHDAHSIYWKERQFDNESVYIDFLQHDGNLNFSKDWSVVKSKKITIEDNVWIGLDVLILKGVTIGKGAVVAAKSVITKDVPPNTLVAGNPAQIVKEIEN